MLKPKEIIILIAGITISCFSTKYLLTNKATIRTYSRKPFRVYTIQGYISVVGNEVITWWGS